MSHIALFLLAVAETTDGRQCVLILTGTAQYSYVGLHQ